VVLPKTGNIALQPPMGGPVALNNQGLVAAHNKLLQEYLKAEHYLTELLLVVKNITLEGEIRREMNLPRELELERDEKKVITGNVVKKAKKEDLEVDV
jgi:hypothetical protein